MLLNVIKPELAFIRKGGQPTWLLRYLPSTLRRTPDVRGCCSWKERNEMPDKSDPHLDGKLDPEVLKGADKSKRSFLKKLIGGVFAVPVIASFTLDALSPQRAFGLTSLSSVPTPTGTHTPGATLTHKPYPTGTNTPGPTLTQKPYPTGTHTPGPTQTMDPRPTLTHKPYPTGTHTPGLTQFLDPKKTHGSWPTQTYKPDPIPIKTPNKTVTYSPKPWGEDRGRDRKNSQNTPIPKPIWKRNK